MARGDTIPMDPIAVVGVSCRLPGGANSIDGLWELLERGGEAWSPVPKDRFNETAFHHPSPDDPNGTNHHRGGHFIDGDVRDFDHSFFHILPQQALAMDPQQRILLEMSYEAFESAGWPRETYAGSKTAVYAAGFTMDYERNLYRDPLDLPVYYITGTEKAILANRISHNFDLHGPSVSLDTGCSGGLVALHQACQSLRDGESDAALVAAANLTLGPDHHIGMSTVHLISGTGHSYPFDNRGDGYGRGEGFVVLALKRLDDALRDRDPIRSVIRCTAVNQDGYTPASITNPNEIAQEDLVRAAYARVGLRPQDVAYVEAHGTGTVAGDTAELGALSKVFNGPERSLPLYVGSIKGSIGHTENTSGLASLLKAALVLDRQLIPPVAGFINPKPELALDRMRISIPTEVVPLPHVDGITPRASVNSFGFGGANAHAILERGPRALDIPYLAPSPRLFVLSANSPGSLEGMIDAHIEWVDQHPETVLADLSYTLCHRRTPLPWRFSCVAGDKSSLLRGFRQGIDSPPTNPVPTQTDIIYVFTGQGAQWAGMGRELLLEETPSPVFRNSIRTSRDILLELGATWDLEAELLRDASEPTLLNTAELAQPATTAIQIAIVALLRAQGLRPRAVVGHSSGEIAAAYTAGYISQRTALSAAFHRGFMAALSKESGLPRGAMMSVGLSEREAAPYLEGLTKGVAGIACVNSPSNVTISGDADAVDEMADRLAKEDGIFYRRLIVDTAYHSHHMRAVADDYRSRLRKLDAEDPATNSDEITFISSVSGTLKSSNFDTEYWTSNLTSPVRFCDAVQELARHRAASAPGRHSFFIEIGPHSALAGPVRQSLAGPDIPKLEFDYHSALQRKVGAVESTLILAGRLFERGVKLDNDAVSALTPGFDSATVRSDLPAYAWDHTTKHWHESRVTHDYLNRRDPYHDLLGVRVADSTAIEPRWRHMVGLATLPWLADHVVDGLPIFPGSGYLCMAAEAVIQLSRERHPQRLLETLVLRDVSFLRGLVIPDRPQRVEMQLSFKPQSSTIFGFSFTITALSDGEWREHCTGIVEGVLADNVTEELPSLADLKLLPDGTTLTTDDLYRELATAGNTYGPTFAGIRTLTLSSDVSQASTVMTIPNTAAIMPAQHEEPHLIHPSTLDILLHTCLPIVGRNLDPGAIMPVHIDELLLSATKSMPREPGSELHALTTLVSSHFRTAYADISVAAGDALVLSASGIEMRSLGEQPNPLDSATNEHGICYELDWKKDIDHIRIEDLPSNPDLRDLIGHICFKNSNLSAVELGAGRGDLTRSFLNAVKAHDGTLASYDFIDVTPELFDEARERFRDQQIRYRTLNPEGDLVAQGFEPHSYDVILLSTFKYLDHASTLLKPNGLLVLVLEQEFGSPDDSWRAIIQESANPLNVQLTFYDRTRGALIAVARPINTEAVQIPADIRILTHSEAHSAPAWVTEIVNGLRTYGANVSQAAFEESTVGAEADSDDSFIIVVDDQPQPILSDPRCFSAVTTLLKRPARIFWLSPDTPLPMHQITGVARTAHAENEKLRLTTFHVAPDMLGHSRLPEVLASCLRHATRDGEPHREREYRVRGDGSAVVPRLRRSEQLNRAISTEDALPPEIELRLFVDRSRPLVLSTDTINNGTSSAVFVDHKDALDAHLADDAIEIETEAVALSEPCLAASLGQYVGTITRVGASVNTIAPGDRVVALGSVVGASHPQIPYTHAGRLPLNVPSTAAAALLLSTMAACHALHRIARLSSRGTVLVHGALSPIGRAAVAVARSIGARVTVTAADPEEARLLMDQHDIVTNDVLITRRSLHRQSPRKVFANGIDVIIQAGNDVVPAEALAHLKPFGYVVITGPSAHATGSVAAAATQKLPRNAAVHFCDIVAQLQAYPDITSSLIEKATTALEHLSTDGINFHVRDIGQVSEALRLLDKGVYTQVILQAEPTSVVPAVVAQNTQSDGWDNENVSYLVVGGLGDLGQRLMTLMARRGAKHLVTLSRRVVDPDDYQKLQAQLEAIQTGCKLHCLQCDITSESSVQNAAATLVSKGVPPVRGVIHSAAILQDRTLGSMTYDDYLLASRMKVDGTLALERAFASPRLDFFLMLSSAVNIVGASGQANYNAGNAVQDAIAQAHRGGPCHFMSLSIGWIEDAIHTADNDARLSGLRRAGLRPILHDELSRYFDYALGASTSKARLPQAIIGFDAASLSGAIAHNGNVRSAIFSHVYNSSESAADKKSQKSDVLTFSQVIAGGDHDSVVDFISSAIVNQLARLVSVDVSRINDRQGSILALGLDSLVVIELRNWIMREFDAPLQSSEVMSDQTVRTLAEKVATRTRVVAESLNDGTSEEGSIDDHDKSQGSPSVGTAPSSVSASTNIKEKPIVLPPVPLPGLEETLRRFEDSRRAIDSPEDQKVTASAIQELLEGPGPELQRQLEGAGPDAIADAYERQVYLERREPLQDYSEYSVGHPVDAPAHSQATRAAILTVAGIDFSRRLIAGEIAPDTLHGIPLTAEARDWLFYTTRRPGAGVDRMERYTPNQTIAILRRGHVFQMTLPESETPPNLLAVYAAYNKILGISDEQQPTVCTLTADERDSWATLRHELELDPDNAAALAVLDSAAFVVCLDDESPSNAGERHMQFLLNGQHQPFANRWLDKPAQFAVTANGLSAGIFEHSKVDGMDVRTLHAHITREIFAQSSKELESSSAAPYPIREYAWKPSPAIVQRIEHVRLRCKAYGPLDHQFVNADNLGLDFLHDHGALPNATAHLTALLALYLVDRTVRPAWEIASLATFARGRLDWVQTVSPAVRAFVEAAAAAAPRSPSDKTRMRSLFDAAAAAHSRAISSAALGHGFVNHLYALRGALALAPGPDDDADRLPALFRSPAWDATRRGGPGQDLKVGFMPDDDPDSPHVRWDEGGFLMEGDRGVYVHCGVHERHTSFTVSARPGYAAAVSGALREAADTVSSLLA
ncbi:polyketide synthase [Biscogniauxia marginata]|nr:polyketide synthase [Biscogniauxia marginata]